MRHILVVLFLFIFVLSNSQDVVYDSIYGNRNYWLRLSIGPNEIPVKVSYENDAYLTQSKVLSAAGLIDNLEKNVDYIDRKYDSDTITVEINTDTEANLIVYKYQYNDSISRYFIGIRKAVVGDDMFSGKYIFIIPMWIDSSVVRVYNGIGSSKQLFKTFHKSQLNDAYITDYQLGRQVTLQNIYASKLVRMSKTRGILTSVEDLRYKVSIYPNPTSDYITIEFNNNPGIVCRLFDTNSRLIYNTHQYGSLFTIDVSDLSSGVYSLVLSKNNYIIKTTKIVVK